MYIGWISASLGDTLKHRKRGRKATNAEGRAHLGFAVAAASGNACLLASFAWRGHQLFPSVSAAAFHVQSNKGARHGSLEPPIGQGVICSQETKYKAVFYDAYRF